MTIINVTVQLGNMKVAGQTFADFKEKLARLVPRALRVASRSAERRLKAITPISNRPWERVPGGLRDSLKVWVSAQEVRAEWSTPYASYIDKGTPAHVVLGNMHWQAGPGIWGHSEGHMVRGIKPHDLTGQAQMILKEELEVALISLVLAEIGGVVA